VGKYFNSYTRQQTRFYFIVDQQMYLISAIYDKHQSPTCFGAGVTLISSLSDQRNINPKR
jgi:hypothetical protein